MDWQIRVRRGYSEATVEDAAARMAVLRRCMEEPNAADSFRVLWEQVLEDLLVGGFGAVEMEATGDPLRPFHLWAVDGATIQMDSKWDGDPEKPRYAQATGRLGKEGMIPLLDDELMYVRLNPRTHTRVWTGAAGGGVRDGESVSEREPVCGAAGEQLGGAVCACG